VIELDHVIVAGPHTELPSVEGGRHEGWGTANRIVPLGAAYLELVTVVDHDEAETNAFGRWVAAAPPGPLGWAVRTSTLDRVADRLGLQVVEGSRPTPSGELLRWRAAGFEQSAAEPMLPFFLEWAEDAPYPGRAAAAAGRIVRLELTGDAARLDVWLGPADLPLTVRPGASGIARVLVELDGRLVEI
jgi:hypothetical protein